MLSERTPAFHEIGNKEKIRDHSRIYSFIRFYFHPDQVRRWWCQRKRNAQLAM